MLLVTGQMLSMCPNQMQHPIWNIWNYFTTIKFLQNILAKLNLLEKHEPIRTSSICLVPQRIDIDNYVDQLKNNLLTLEYALKFELYNS